VAHSENISRRNNSLIAGLFQEIYCKMLPKIIEIENSPLGRKIKNPSQVKLFVFSNDGVRADFDFGQPSKSILQKN